LLVEDEEDVAYVIKYSLEQAGYKVSHAADGELAWGILEALTPDLILLDVMMPKLDGYSLNQRLKANERTKDVPVLVITGREQMSEMFKDNERDKITKFMLKPFSMKALKEAIEEILKDKIDG